MLEFPDGYKKLEYIESTGEQWIDTKFKPNENTRTILIFEPTKEYSSISGVFGVRDTAASNAAKMYVLWNSGAAAFRTDYFGTQQTLSVSTLLAKHTADKNKYVTAIGNGIAVNVQSSGQCANNMYLFGVNNAGSVNYLSSYKLFCCLIYDNGNLIRKFFPCKNISSEAGLYDFCENQFYGNSGSGVFIAGPEEVNSSTNVFAKVNNIWVPASAIYTKRDGSW